MGIQEIREDKTKHDQTRKSENKMIKQDKI